MSLFAIGKKIAALPGHAVYCRHQQFAVTLLSNFKYEFPAYDERVDMVRRLKLVGELGPFSPSTTAPPADLYRRGREANGEPPGSARHDGVERAIADHGDYRVGQFNRIVCKFFDFVVFYVFLHFYVLFVLCVCVFLLCCFSFLNEFFYCCLVRINT